jgi:hypothetical protein
MGEGHGNGINGNGQTFNFGLDGGVESENDTP